MASSEGGFMAAIWSMGGRSARLAGSSEVIRVGKESSPSVSLRPVEKKAVSWRN